MQQQILSLSILSFQSMLFLLYFSARFNSFYDAIMLPGTINTVVCCQKSWFDDFSKIPTLLQNQFT